MVDAEADAFGTARLRTGVLDAWQASPARFREDANAEQELVLGGYRDRLVVELAQNAADAAARARVPGRLRLTLTDGVLVVANNGAPLDAAGVESLSTLRASAKREQEDTAAVGRFGVGFSAVLAVTDEPAVVGRTGGVRWSLAEARDMVRDAAREVPELGEELRRRDGHAPLLRLPLPAEGTAPDGYETAVVLPLRDPAAEELAQRLLAAVDDALLLTLPGLREVVVELPGESARTLTRRDAAPPDGGADGTDDTGAPHSAEAATGVVEIRSEESDGTSGVRRWRVARAAGRAGRELLADRPVEERLRSTWSVTWAVPEEDGRPVRPPTAQYVHAPTPTDEPLGLPALLIASFPLDPTRRHVARGPLTDFLLDRAADTYVRLLRDWRPSTPELIGLVPGPLGKSELDGELRQALLSRLPGVPFLAGAATGEDGAPVVLRPREAEIAEGAGAETVAVLAELFPGLLPAGMERRTELRALDVARVPLGEIIDRLAGVERPPQWWWRLYDSLAGVDPDRLTGLPVPLAGDQGRPAGSAARTAVGPRQVLLPLPGEPMEEGRARRLARLGLKVAHPDAAHPLLEKLGATGATPRAVLGTPQVRAAVAASLDAEDTWDGGLGEEGSGPLDAEELADVVLGLVRDARLAPGDEPWLGALALPDEDGELAPAGELVYPGSPFESVIREGELAACDAELADRWGEQPLTAVGVQATFALVRAVDVVIDPDETEPREGDFPEPDDIGLLDAVDVWCEDVLDQLPESETAVPPVAAEVVAVRDLDLVDDDCWPQVLAMLAEPPLRDALTAPVRVLMPGGGTEVVRPYTAWWLRGHPVLDGRRPAGLRAAGGDPLLDGLYDEADASGFADEQVLRALGIRTSAAALLEEPGGAAELLGRLADDDAEVGHSRLHGLYGLLARLDPDEVTLPDEVRAVVAATGDVDVVPRQDAFVADAPDLVALAGRRALLPVPPAVADDLAEVLEVRRLSDAVPGAVDEAASGEGTERDVPEAVRLLLPDAPLTYREHDELVVDGQEADWRRTPDGVLHAATLEGVAAGLAWAAGQWSRRFEVAALLEDPDRVAELERARWFD